MTVLLVDDDPAILGVMKMRLEQRGYRVATANSALAAERQAIKEQPEFALVDVIMPGINGVELCRRLTSSPDLPPQLRVVMWSSINDLPIIEAATRAGASGYIVKSSDLNAMLADVLRWLEAPADEATTNVLHPLLFNKSERSPSHKHQNKENGAATLGVWGFSPQLLQWHDVEGWLNLAPRPAASSYISMGLIAL